MYYHEMITANHKKFRHGHLKTCKNMVVLYGANIDGKWDVQFYWQYVYN